MVTSVVNRKWTWLRSLFGFSAKKSVGFGLQNKKQIEAETEHDISVKTRTCRSVSSVFRENKPRIKEKKVGFWSGKTDEKPTEKKL